MGAEYCRQLAARGFNIVLVSRTLSKLESVAKEVQTANPKVEVKIIQANFSDNSNIKFY